VTDKNIFNANRTRGWRQGGSGKEESPTRTETFTLVGTLAYEKGPFAFFDGSSSAFRQVLEPGKMIGDYKIVAIRGRGVVLQTGTNSVELAVGMQMKRENDGAWIAVSSGSLATTGRMTAKEPTGSADENEVVKRLMQQREEDLK